jgi:site-specific DNA-methyltransferase (adenine-specific)
MSEINFFNCDCIEFMKSKPDKCYDLAIVDPPYGIGASDYKRGGTQNGNSKAKCKEYGSKNWDNATPTTEYWNELKRISENQIVWGANHFISKIPFDSSCWIVWDKENGENGYADCELAWTSFKSAVRKFKWKWQGMLQQNMKNKQNRIHPTEKPIELYRWILQNYAKQGDKILDTHGGSMSSAIACHIEGFDLDICEIDKDYFEAGVKRFNIYKQQQTLF